MDINRGMGKGIKFIVYIRTRTNLYPHNLVANIHTQNENTNKNKQKNSLRAPSALFALLSSSFSHINIYILR